MRPATTSARSSDSWVASASRSPAGGRSSRSTRPASGPGDLRAVDIETAPYPGLATDVQPPTCVLLTQASGTSRVHEAVFEDRIEWLGELRELGASIDIEDAHHASIHGPARLHGAEASISDLRAGASLILAALAADGAVGHPRCAPRPPGV